MAESTFQVVGDTEAPAPATGDKETPVTGADTNAPEKKAEGEQAEGDKDQAQIDADKKAADEQAANDADAKALLFDSMKDLKLPDGVITDDKLMGEFTEWAKSNKMTKAQAQAAADLHMKSVGVFAQKLQADAQEQVKAWGKQIIDDKDLGGAKLPATLESVEKIFTLPVPGWNVSEFKADLVRTGMANHPGMIRLVHFVAQHVGDDKTFIGDRNSGGELKSDAEVLYANHK